MIGFRRHIRMILMVACLGFLAAGVLFAVTPSRADDMSKSLQSAKAALQRYQDPIVAVREGYFSTIACIEFPKAGTLASMPYPAGGMGVHLLNMSYVGGKLDPAHPQVLIYQPVAGALKLAAAEWFVPVSPKGTARPELFGHPFYGPMMGHYPVMPASFVHYDLHVWLWKDNPAGMFSPTNPTVKCPAGVYTYEDSTPKMPMAH